MTNTTHIIRTEVIGYDMHIQAIHERIYFETNHKEVVRQIVEIDNSMRQLHHVIQKGQVLTS